MVKEVLCNVIQLWLIAVFARIILSWFPLPPAGAMSTVFGILYTITEPVMGPIRRIIPSVGMFDISPIVVFFGAEFVLRALGCTGGFF